MSCLTAFAAMTLRLANQAQLNCNVRVNALLCSPPSFICLGEPATLSVCISEGEQLSNLGASTYHTWRQFLIVTSIIPISVTFLFSLYYILANPSSPYADIPCARPETCSTWSTRSLTFGSFLLCVRRPTNQAHRSRRGPRFDLSSHQKFHFPMNF